MYFGDGYAVRAGGGHHVLRQQLQAGHHTEQGQQTGRDPPRVQPARPGHVLVQIHVRATAADLHAVRQCGAAIRYPKRQK